MKRLRICLGILVALVFQAAVVPALFPRWIVPDVVFCASAVAAITGVPPSACWWRLWAG